MARSPVFLSAFLALGLMAATHEAALAQAPQAVPPQGATQQPMAPETPATVVKAGSLEIATPWLRATPNGAKVAGGYLTVTNHGSEADKLVSAAIPLAGSGEIHEMNMENGMMHMHEVAGGLEIKPGETVTLKPGSYHLMFMDMRGSLKEGDTVEGALTFAKAGKVMVTFKVGGLADKTPPGESK